MLSLSTVAVLPSTQVKVESSRMEHVLINRKHNKVNKKKKKTLLTPSLLLQILKLRIYSKYKMKTCLLVLKTK